MSDQNQTRRDVEPVVVGWHDEISSTQDEVIRKLQGQERRGGKEGVKKLGQGEADPDPEHVQCGARVRPAHDAQPEPSLTGDPDPAPGTPPRGLGSRRNRGPMRGAVGGQAVGFVLGGREPIEPVHRRSDSRIAGRSSTFHRANQNRQSSPMTTQYGAK